MRQRIVSRLPPEILLDVLEDVVAVAAERDDHAVRQQTVDGDVLGH